MKSLKLWVLGCVMLFAGVQNASAALKGCEGTVYLKLPDGWTTAFTAGGGNFDGFTKRPPVLAPTHPVLDADGSLTPPIEVFSI